MESVRSKKVRSRRTPVANLASFAPRESGFLQTGIDRVPQRHAPRPSRQSRAPHATAPFSHRGTRPSRRPSRTRQPTLPPATRAPESIQARTPPRAAKARRPRPSAPPRRYAPLCEHPSNIRRGVLRTAAPHHVPTRRPALRLKGRTLVSRLRQPSPPLALIELQSHPRRSDEIAIHPRIAEALPKFAFHPFQKRVNGVA